MSEWKESGDPAITRGTEISALYDMLESRLVKCDKPERGLRFESRSKVLRPSARETGLDSEPTLSGCRECNATTHGRGQETSGAEFSCQMCTTL